MSKNKIFFPILLLALSLTLSGCISVNTGEKNNSDTGGVFVSSNKGELWAQKVLIPTNTGKPKTLAGVDVNALVFDPSDSKAIYLASSNNGLFYTYDGGDNWQIAESLGKIDVLSVAVDPSSKCIIYAASGNKVFKSTDCSRSWEQVYYDNDKSVSVNTIAIDHYNSANVYIGLSRGDILASSDRGDSWRTLHRLDNDIKEIVISPADSRIMYAGTARKGVFRTMDSGTTWEDLSEKLKEFKNSNNFRDLEVNSSIPGLIILANDYGLLKSSDNGDTWVKIELITPEKEAIINTVALNPNNADEIYYSTNTTFYRSLDGGVNWTTKALPTIRGGSSLLVSPESGNIIYLGFKAVAKK